MTKVDSTPTSSLDKPKKPYPDFPLFPHASKQWAKKIRGKLHYFGSWNDPDAALQKYLDQKDALHSGRKPKPDSGDLAVKDLCNQFLNHKQTLVNSGELTTLTWNDYKIACDEIVASFGKARLITDLDPEDFASLRNRMAKKWGHQRLSKTIQFIRCVFKFGFDAGLLAIPMRFGPGFKRPTKKVMRLDRAKQGPKLFTPGDIIRLLDVATVHVRAMILLGINCGFGNSDCGQLPLSALDLVNGWINFPRPKTGIPRRCPLWPETILALKNSLENRPEPIKPEHTHLVFLTRHGDSWHTGTPDGPLSRELGKLLRKLDINGRKGAGFYFLRHTFRTVADGAKDQPSADTIMGHESPHMSSIYREAISDERLRAVVRHVREWLFKRDQGDLPFIEVRP